MRPEILLHLDLYINADLYGVYCHVETEEYMTRINPLWQISGSNSRWMIRVADFSSLSY